MNSLNGKDFLYDATLRGTTKTDSISEDTTNNGVVIDGVTLKDNGILATTFDTNVAAAGVTLSGTTLAADGTDANIDINLMPKGTGSVVIPTIDVNAGSIDGTLMGATKTNVQKGPAAITTATTPAVTGTVTAAASTTVTFSSEADAILAGYHATNPILGTTLISNALTRYIVSWTNATTCVVDSSVTWAGTAITSVQLPIASFVNSAGVTQGWVDSTGSIRVLQSTPTGAEARQIAAGNGLTIDAVANGNIQFRGPSGSVQYIFFGDDDADVGSINYDHSDNSIHYRVGGVSNVFVIKDQNFMIGGLTAAGTSAAKVLAIGSGTAPTAIIADGIQIWSADYASGDARLYFMGEASTSKVAIGNGEVVIPDAGGIVIQPSLSTDHTYCALEKIPAGTAGENLVFGDTCYLAADLKWYKADSSTAATMPAKAIALGTINSAATGAFLKRGYIRDDSRWAAMTVGQDIYPSETAGSLTQTAPAPTTSATVMLQTVGHAPSTNTATVGIIWFDPSSNYTEIGVDVIDFGTDHAVNIALSDLTAIALTYQGDDADNQTATITSQPVAADVGKEFWLIKKGTGAGTMILQLPANSIAVDAAGVTTVAGTLTSEASKYQAVKLKVISTTEFLILCTVGTWTKSS